MLAFFMQKEKATGWRIPLLFCAGIIGLTLIIWLFVPADEAIPTFPEDLLASAKSIAIDLSDSDGKSWLASISSASSGFADIAEKDKKLAAIVHQALEQKRFDAACTALTVLRQEKARNDVINKIIDDALQHCETLPWAVFAYKASKPGEHIGELNNRIISSWRKCKQKKNPQDF